ncbi:MAG: carbohydrate ABC transporter permease [Actinobacteria bacterium]|nr:carbohydrate ABC transporter permease [Actinomycetota bacterium]
MIKTVISKISIGALVAFFFLFLGGPFLWLLGMSVKPPIDILSYEPRIFPKKFYFQNYSDALEKSGIIQAFFNSFVIATISTLIILMLAVTPSYFFARNKGILTKSVSIWILVSQIFPLSLLVIPIFLTMQRLNLINTRPGLILIYIIINLPFALWLLRGFVLSIPSELEEAAQIDGATFTQVIRKVIFPLLAPGLIVVASFTFINVWNEFFFALVILSDPEKSTLPLKLAQFLGAEGRGLFGALAAATTMAIIPSLALFALIQKRFSDNFLAGAVKG